METRTVRSQEIFGNLTRILLCGYVFSIVLMTLLVLLQPPSANDIFWVVGSFEVAFVAGSFVCWTQYAAYAGLMELPPLVIRRALIAGLLIVTGGVVQFSRYLDGGVVIEWCIEVLAAFVAVTVLAYLFCRQAVESYRLRQREVGAYLIRFTLGAFGAMGACVGAIAYSMEAIRSNSGTSLPAFGAALAGIAALFGLPVTGYVGRLIEAYRQNRHGIAGVDIGVYNDLRLLAVLFVRAVPGPALFIVLQLLAILWKYGGLPVDDLSWTFLTLFMVAASVAVIAFAAVRAASGQRFFLSMAVWPSLWAAGLYAFNTSDWKNPQVLVAAGALFLTLVLVSVGVARRIQKAWPRPWQTTHRSLVFGCVIAVVAFSLYWVLNLGPVFPDSLKVLVLYPIYAILAAMGQFIHRLPKPS